MSAPQLHHFTCKDGHRRIGRFNALLIPQGGIHPYAGWPPLLWFTVLAEPDRTTTGLGAVTLTCDRMEHRYVIAPGSGCVHWPESRWRAETPEKWLKLLEEYGDPEHWWVSDSAVKATWDRAYAKAYTRRPGATSARPLPAHGRPRPPLRCQPVDCTQMGPRRPLAAQGHPAEAVLSGRRRRVLQPPSRWPRGEAPGEQVRH